MTTLIRNEFNASGINDYLIAGNVANAFVLGEIGSPDDFFLVGAQPEEESSYPILTGNILDSEGNVLFRLVRNNLVVNPGHCSRILSDHVGYEIHDSAGVPIFRVRTMFERLPNRSEESFVTTLAGAFYNKAGELVFSANSGEPDERIEAVVKSAFGFSGGFGLVQGFSQEEMELVRVALMSRGAIHQPLRGLIEDQVIELDGKVLMDAQLQRCEVHVATGDFAAIGQVGFSHCSFAFHGPADNIRNLVLALANQSGDA